MKAANKPLDARRRGVLSLRAVNLGLWSNIGLAALKTTIGIVGGSSALLADGVNSTSDVVYYIVVRIFMQLARKPADHEHPFGHSQLESIAAVVVGAFVITTAVGIFWGAVNEVFNLSTGQAQPAGAALITLIVALLTIALKLALMLITFDIKRQTGNAAVAALAYDHRNDIFSASAAALGIFLSRNGLPLGDPVAGALVALLILRTGIKIIQDASSDLMDNVPGKELAVQVNDLLAAVPGIGRVEEVYAHRFGPYLVLYITIGIDGSLSVLAGDQISSEAERTLMANIPLLRRVHIHYHPAGVHQVPDPYTLPRSIIDW
ncbi:MAG: Ferrous-iron efflux pump FieF [Chloroflexi bacterium ADurb.Bin325]|nr:MAG: Ferrous-iron efflux pump FieF [Chloroflexi bacterium ADurb.Bin325]